MKGVPSASELAVLRERHTGRIVTLSFRDTEIDQSEVFGQFVTAGVPFQVIYGGVNEIQGRPFGHLTLALHADDALVDAALERVRLLTTVTEVR